ncbi:MAG: AAA family ATPase [Planctomycetales bacterium]|nr:AAA family ATPase [Planctomycetales bacterium]
MSDRPSSVPGSLHLLPDSPIESSSFDRLDRMSFVRSFAEAIRSVRGVDSVVLALAGPWGSGKSSLLNLVCAELDKDEGVPPLVVRFNPWWFTGTGRLVTAFVEQLAAAMSRDEVRDSLGGATLALNRLAAAIETPGVEVHSTGASFDAASRDVEMLRREINDIFRASPRRVLIFMDDIDRLTPEEMTQLLLIVRAVADFPNTTYVLAFDHEVVSQAIANRLGVDGRTYLEKVVLLQIDVPMPGRLAMERLVVGQLEAIDPNAARLDEDARRHFRIIFEGGVRHFLSTPRACTRLLNVIRFTYPMLVGQVYFPDMLGISCLLSFSSQAIQAIRSYREAFVGPCDPSGNGWVRLRNYHSGWLSEVQSRDRAAVETIVRGLFPKVAWALNGPLRGPKHAEEWSRLKRICSERHFEAYFRLGISEGDANERRWKVMVDLLDDATAFARALDRFGPLDEAGPEGPLSDLLQQAADFVIEQANSEQAANLFRAIVRRGDNIAAVHGVEDSQPIDHMQQVVTLLIECLAHIDDPAERLRELTEAVGDDAGLLTAAELLDSLDYRPRIFCDHGEPDPDAHTAKLVEVLKVLDRRIQEAADDGRLAEHPMFMKVVQKWWKFGRKSKSQKWVRQHCRDDEMFVAAIMQTRPSSGLEAAASSKDGAHVADPTHTLPVELLMELFSHAVLLERTMHLLNDQPAWLTDEAFDTLSTLAQLLP